MPERDDVAVHFRTLSDALAYGTQYALERIEATSIDVHDHDELERWLAS